MSPTGHALHARFGDICRSELQRLHKKTALFSPEQRAEVHALTLEVAERLAQQLSTNLTSVGGANLDAVVRRLFALGAADPGEK